MRKALGALATAVVVGTIVTAIPSHADAFCGFYVSGADAKLFNNATQVVLMREGTRTVLSMSNNYQGPPKDFAMVVPVPVVLQKENVKTLPKDIFSRIDQLSAPRLVEYWEQDPCEHTKWKNKPVPRPMMRSGAAPAAEAAKAADLGVTVEAKFAVGEYEIVILSAKDSTGLDTWIRQEGYAIPAGAETYLRPYVQAGSKFFVAKVDTKKVTFDAQGMAQLSPLRFHYDAETFSLPIRLGLMNSNGTQDLIVHILAKGQRYEVSNYPNVTIPTNFDVADTAKTQFGSFYAALFDRTLEKVPKGIVTEYSWDAQSCDPCPSPPLTPSELSTLGVDVLPSTLAQENAANDAPPTGRNLSPAPRPARRPPSWGSGGFTLTRLHARYGKDSLGEDLVFRAASAIVGGREIQGANGKMEHGATASSTNNFQGRYIIRHPWTGAITCKDPQRGIWGGPPGGGEPKPTAAQNLAFAPRGKLQLATFVKGGALPEVVALPGAVTPLGSPVVPVPASVSSSSSSPSDDGAFGTNGGNAKLTDAGGPPTDGGPSVPPTTPPTKSGCGCDLAPTTSFAAAPAAFVALLFAARRRRRAR